MTLTTLTCLLFKLLFVFLVVSVIDCHHGPAFPVLFSPSNKSVFEAFYERTTASSGYRCDSSRVFAHMSGSGIVKFINQSDHSLGHLFIERPDIPGRFHDAEHKGGGGRTVRF